MDLESVKDILREWAGKHLDIRTVYIYGSRATGDFNRDSDLDIAIELDPKHSHINGYGLWVSCSEEYERAVKSLLSESNVHLEYCDKENTPTVTAAVESSGFLVYSRDKDEKDEPDNK